MTPISRVNRDIFHDIARRKGARASRFRHPFSPCVPPPVLSLLLPHHSADPPEVDEKFSELLSRELSRRAPTTSRKFRDVNAIALRAAADRRPDFACSRVPASSKFIGHCLANCFAHSLT